MGRPKKEAPNRKDGLYEVKITIGHDFKGNPVRKSFYSTVSKGDAKAKAEQWKIDHAVQEITGEIPASSDMPFDTWARRVLESVKGTIKDSSYQLHYKNTVENHLIPYFGKRGMQDIRKIDIQKYFQDNRELSLETLKKHKMVLHRIFSEAIQNEILRTNPCDNVKISSTKNRIQKRTYTEEQCELVLEYAKTHRFGADVHLLLGYGLNRSELLGLQWDDIDFDGLVLSVVRGVTDSQNADTGKMEVLVGAPKTDFRRRDIPISTETAAILAAIPRNGIFVFCNGKGNVQSPRTWSRRHFDVFMQDMHAYYLKRGIDVPMLHPHELRHTRATLWVNSGKNLFAVADVLGHSDLKMLRKRYAHSDVESTRNLLEIDGSKKQG